MTQAFSFSRRLHRRDEFEPALQKKALIDKWLALHSIINTSGSERLGIVVSKRVVAKAAARNRIKRIIREIFRQNVYEGVGSLDIVVRVRKNFNEDETVEFRRSLSRLLMKVRMTKDDAPVSIPHKGLSVSD